MSSGRKTLSRLYFAIAAIALIATWRQNLAFMNDAGVGLPEGFATFWPALLVNRATTSITVDIFMVALVTVVFMVLEARRLQMRFPWLYVLGGIMIAISFTFPLFMALREQRLAELDPAATEPTPSAGDKLGLAFMTLCTFAFALYCTLR